MASRSEPVVSIIMAMRDAAATIGLAIRSLQWQTLQDWELILIDDGSHDASAQIVAALHDARIRMQSDGDRRGLAARLNQAVDLARGDFIARMDADDVCYPERLAKQVGFLKVNPGIDLVGCSAAVFANDGKLVGLMTAPRRHHEIVAKPWRGFPLPHPTWCGRAAWFRQHRYDSSLPRAQDQELLLRCSAGSSLAGLPEVLLGYRQQSLNLNNSLRGRAVFARALWRHARRNWPLTTVFGGIAGQMAKGAADVAMLCLGLGQFAQQLRLDAPNEETKASWSLLWDALHAEGAAPSRSWDNAVAEADTMRATR